MTMKKVCAGLLEQLGNLQHYFITFLPTTPSFKSTVAGTERYQRIVSKLNDPLAVPYIAFVVYVANHFEHFLTTFQSMRSRIHILYTEMVSLITKLMTQFVKSRNLYNLVEDKEDNKMKTAKPFSEVSNVKVSDRTQCKTLKLLEVGKKAKSSFAESLQISDEEKKFRENCLKTYQVSIFETCI